MHLLLIDISSGVTVQSALRRNSIEITEESLLQLKYDPNSVWGYIEVSNITYTFMETHNLAQPPE